ncbi:Pre-rRNA-processing protein ESF2-like protein [Elsinoe fawcettii]|nr:Pre-rRNA-processing protein ESF2-like protein [Elsinoe fawcettii]
MPSRKRNEWLDDGDDEDVALGVSDSEDDFERSKAQITSRSIKRRKLDDGADSEHDDFSDEADLDKSVKTGTQSTVSSKKTAELRDSRFASFPGEDEDAEEDGDNSAQHEQTYLPEDDLAQTAASSSTPHSAADVAKKAKAKKKTGVIYISRIPPFMKPATVRSYLEPYGQIGKLFLTPEDHATYTRRKKSGGNKKHSYVDGWVEFLSKKDAKMVASVLNGNIIGGKKGNYYHDDMWNIKYLTGFKWDDLTEQIQRENKEREARLRTEITKAKRENEAFVRDIERGKMVEGIKSKRKDRDQEAHPRAAGGEGDRPRQFKQNVVKRKKKDQSPTDDRAGKVLSMII